jgi:SAM-dependent methyltransferase
MPVSQLEEVVQSLRPASVLDVGCGCGRHLTSLLSQHCARVFAIDVVSYTSRWRELMRSRGIQFCRMDASALAFPRDTFPLVLARDALHHIERWPHALSEMLRVSSARVLIEEPVDELRSPAKQRTYEAQGLLLELQQEVGYSHYRHLKPEALLSSVRSQARVLEVKLDRCDTPVAFDEFFESYSVFASQSGREEYWLGRLEELRSRFHGAALSDDDRLTVLVAAKAPPS